MFEFEKRHIFILLGIFSAVILALIFLLGGKSPTEAESCKISIDCEPKSNASEGEHLEVSIENEWWTEDDVFCLACVAYQEAGSQYHSNLTRRYVIDVVLNRVNDSRFPNTIRGVLEDAPNGAMQYGRFSVTGVQMLKKWTTEEERRQEEELFMLCWVDAENALRGDHTELYGNGYIWQAEFGQGVSGFWQDGIFFGKG